MWSNKTVVVSGGASGVGRALAILAAERGANVVVCDHDESGGAETLRLAKAEGGQCFAVKCDVRKLDDCEKAMRNAQDAYESIDVLVNCAGVAVPHRTVLTTTEDEWRYTIDVNVTGVFLMSKAAIPYMKAGGGGAIVNVGSIWGFNGAEDAAPYCASKGAVILLTKAMALDFARDNIRVNCICPGSIDSPMLRRAVSGEDDEETALRRYAAKHPMKRLSTPLEQARVALFLASEESSFVTGAIVPVDGGRSAGEQKTTNPREGGCLA